MGILPMSLTGVPPVQMPKNMGKMPMRLMGETPMLRRVAFFNGLLTVMSKHFQLDFFRRIAHVTRPEPPGVRRRI